MKERAWQSRAGRRAHGTRSGRSSAPRASGPGSRSSPAPMAIGTAGYIVLEGWDFLDALYMTVISVTTVGFKEVRELDAMRAHLDDDHVGDGSGPRLRDGGPRHGVPHPRGDERKEPDATDGEGGRGAEQSLRPVRLWAGRLDRGPGAGARGHPVRGHRREPGLARAGAGRRAPRGRRRRDGRRDAARGRDRAGARPDLDDRLGRPERLRDPLGPGDQPLAPGGRPGRHAVRRGEARPRRRQPDRLAVHDGGPAPRRAGDPAAGRRLPRRRPLPR